MTGAKVLKGRLDMKSKLGFRTGEVKMESVEIPFPPREDITWQSPNIFPAGCDRDAVSYETLNPAKCSVFG